jgi:hypothetical protein
MYFRESGGSCEITAENIVITIGDGTKITFSYNTMSNIPLKLTREPTTVSLTAHNVEKYLSSRFNVASYLAVADEMNQNITAAQKLLLKWHWRLGHASFAHVQWLAATHRKQVRTHHFNQDSNNFFLQISLLSCLSSW